LELLGWKELCVELFVSVGLSPLAAASGVMLNAHGQVKMGWIFSLDRILLWAYWWDE
jgi:hypothetical protein